MRGRRSWLAAAPLALAALLPGPALAQSMLGNQTSPVVVPPAPPVVAAPPSAPVPQTAPQAQPPGLVQTPLPPANADTGDANAAPVDNGEPAMTPPPEDSANPPPPAAAASGQAPAAPASVQAPAAPAGQNTASSTPPPVPNDWVPEKTAQIGVLDKVDGGASTILVPVGGQTTVGGLRISVLACVTRPPDQVPDDAVFVAVQHADDAANALFRGWMIRSIPGAAVVGDASETLRVVSCG
jgi:hypothetical protein